MVVRLTAFNRMTLDHFIFLERAEDVRVPVAEGFEPQAPEREVRRDGVTPSAQDYATIGELYDSLAEAVPRLAKTLGEEVLIDPAGAGQLDTDILKLPNVVRITDVASALAVIDRIKEEREGSSGAREASHFERFLSIREEWEDLAAQTPDFMPAWPAANDPVMRKPADGVDRVWVTEEPAASYLDLANALYGAMLQLLDQTFTCHDAEDRKAYMQASVELIEARGCRDRPGPVASQSRSPWRQRRHDLRRAKESRLPAQSRAHPGDVRRKSRSSLSARRRNPDRRGRGESRPPVRQRPRGATGQNVT